MGQCEKILPDGERCSNRALPGTQYCDTHSRIAFRPIKKTADTAPPPKPAPKPKRRVVQKRKQQKTETPPPDWKAMPSAAGASLTFPGLQADARNILVGKQGIIWLPTDIEEKKPDTVFNRLVQLLGALSQASDLPGQVRLRQQGKLGDALLFLTPTDPDASNLSAFYDIASSAARLVNGRFYIGEGNAFVQYRDDNAPRGYDVPDFTPPKPVERKQSVLLIAHWGSRQLEMKQFSEVSIVDFCLQVTPVPDVVQALPHLVYALVQPALYPILARYFRAHHLRYRLAHLQREKEAHILFEITPRPGAPVGQAVPAFILDYLSRMPRVTLLLPALQTGNRQILLEWGCRFPLHLPHTANAFGSDEMVVLSTGLYANLRVHPPPQFFDGDQLTTVHAPQQIGKNLQPRPANKEKSLHLPVLLRPDTGPTPPVAALILSNQEMGWLRQLLYRLTGNAFEAYSVCQGKEGTVLHGGTHPVEGIPFGIPLRRLGDTEIFIPLRSRFVPDLPRSILRHALNIQENVYTFLTETYRLDLKTADFYPLSRMLVADPERTLVQFNMRTLSTLPELAWTAVPPKIDHEDVDESEQLSPQQKSALWDKLMSFQPQESIREAADIPSSGTKPTGRTRTSVEADEVELPAYLLAQARGYESSKDFLAAAFCYRVLGDTTNSGRCFRQALKRNGM